MLSLRPVGWRRLLPAGWTSQARRPGNGAPSWWQPSPAALPGFGQVGWGRCFWWRAGSWGHSAGPDPGPVRLEGGVQC